MVALVDQLEVLTDVQVQAELFDALADALAAPDQDRPAEALIDDDLDRNPGIIATAPAAGAKESPIVAAAKKSAVASR